jgi:hypothetical protein
VVCCFKSRLASPFQPTPSSQSETHFISKCAPCADDLKIACVLMHHAASRQSLRKNLSVRPTSTDEKFPGSTAKQTILISVENPLYRFQQIHYRVESTHEFPLRCILSRQPARTTLRFRSESSADATASGVRSSTQPTVGVAKGKMTNCRVLRARITGEIVRNLFETPRSRRFFPSQTGPNQTQVNQHLLNFHGICEIPKNSK